MPQFKRYVSAEFVDATGSAIEVPAQAHIFFRVETVSGHHADSAKITIYNLKPSTLARIGSESMTVNLYAGLTSEPPLLFRGEITDSPIFRSDEFTDWIAEIYAEDTKQIAQIDVVSRSYSAGTLLTTIFKDLAAAGGLTADVNAVSAYRIVHQLPQIGTPLKLLKEATALHGYRYQVRNGTAIIVPDGSPISSVLAPVISGATGMIGVPTSKKERGAVKVSVSTRLDANLRAGSLCVIETTSTIGGRKAPIAPRGTYMIESADFICDESQARTEITGRPYES